MRAHHAGRRLARGRSARPDVAPDVAGILSSCYAPAASRCTHRRPLPSPKCARSYRYLMFVYERRFADREHTAIRPSCDNRVCPPQADCHVKCPTTDRQAAGSPKRGKPPVCPCGAIPISRCCWGYPRGQRPHSYPGREILPEWLRGMRRAPIV